MSQHAINDSTGVRIPLAATDNTTIRKTILGQINAMTQLWAECS